MAGCISVAAHKAPGVSLSQYKTFAFYEAPATAGQQMAFERSLAGQTIREQLTTNLEAKGMRQAAPGEQADMLIAYHLRTRERLQYTDWGYPAGWGWGWYGGWYPGYDVSSYTEGTILVDFMDARTHQVVWRGTASQIVDHPDNPNPHDLAKATDKLMQRAHM
jgi:hypothetical protein